MKPSQLLCFLFLASLTWGQSSITPSRVNGQPQPLHLPSNSQYASAAPMGRQQNLLGAGAYNSAKGERPLWEVAPQTAPIPLGDTARALRKQHETTKKATFIREN